MLLRLNNQTRMSNGDINARCPVCGDSKKSKNKRRFWVFLSKKDPYVYCHNCNYSNSLIGYLKEYDEDAYNKLLQERRNEFEYICKNVSKPPVEHKEETDTDLNLLTLDLSIFRPAKNFSVAVKYIKDRKIEHKIDDLYISKDPKFKNMLIFPSFYDKENLSVHLFQGRKLDYKFFKTYNENKGLKIFNYFCIDKSKPIYIFESIIDSYSIDNSIAMLGANVNSKYIEDLPEPIFVYDNDNTGYIQMGNVIDKGYKVFIPPKNWKYKDFNGLS